MPKRITEASTLTITESATPGRVLLQLITPGWGSSGYYSAPVLENAATEQVWPKGTHVFFDHPSESERHDRPERSVRDLAMILDEDARRDPETGGLVAEAKVIGPYRDLVTDEVFMEAVGMSIRASADTTVGEAEGRKGTIVTHLVEGVSVDLVTRAGRGGRILAAVESARTLRESRNVGQWVESQIHRDFTVMADEMAANGRLTRDERIGLSNAIGDALAAFVANLEANQSHLYQRDPWDDPEDAPSAAAIGEATPSVPAPAGQSTATESEEIHMATTTIEEATLTSLRSDAERVPTLESERDTAIRERDEAREANAHRDRTDTARGVIETQAREAGVTFTALESRGLLTHLPVTESGDLDEAAYTTSVKEAAAEKAEQTGAGHVTGFGQTVTENGGDTYSEAEFDKAFNYTAQEA